MARLTMQQRLFVTAYMESMLSLHKNPGKEAAETAGYKNPGTKYKDLLDKPHIKQAITRRTNNIRAKNPELLHPIEGNEDLLSYLYTKALKTLKAVLDRNVLDYCDENGYLDLSNMEGWTREMGDVVEAVKVIQTTDQEGNPRVQTELKWAPKLQATRQVMELWQRLNEDTNEQQTVTIDWDAHLEKSQEERRLALENDPLEQRIASEE